MYLQQAPPFHGKAEREGIPPNELQNKRSGLTLLNRTQDADDETPPHQSNVQIQQARDVEGKRASDALASTNESTCKKRKISYAEEENVWTDDMHRSLVAAIFEAGIAHSSPSVIAENMTNPPAALTSERMKSHLQKFRKARKREKEAFLEDYDKFLVESQLQAKDMVGDLIRLDHVRGGGAAAGLTSLLVKNDGKKDRNPADLTERFVTIAKTETGTNAARVPLPNLTPEEKSSGLGQSFNLIVQMVGHMEKHLVEQRQRKPATSTVNLPHENVQPREKVQQGNISSNGTVVSHSSMSQCESTVLGGDFMDESYKTVHGIPNLDAISDSGHRHLIPTSRSAPAMTVQENSQAIGLFYTPSSTPGFSREIQGVPATENLVAASLSGLFAMNSTKAVPIGNSNGMLMKDVLELSGGGVPWAFADASSMPPAIAANLYKRGVHAQSLQMGSPHTKPDVAHAMSRMMNPMGGSVYRQNFDVIEGFGNFFPVNDRDGGE